MVCWCFPPKLCVFLFLSLSISFSIPLSFSYSLSISLSTSLLTLTYVLMDNFLSLFDFKINPGSGKYLRFWPWYTPVDTYFYTWISVTSRGFFGSQATAALQVMVLPGLLKLKIIKNKISLATLVELFLINQKKKIICNLKSYNCICIPKSFNTNISYQLVDYKIPFVNPQQKNTN